jgi:hypothetical protein
MSSDSSKSGKPNLSLWPDRKQKIENKSYCVKLKQGGFTFPTATP